MTDDEALRLVPGDHVRTFISGQERLAVVVANYGRLWDGAVGIRVRRVGQTPTGRPHNGRRRHARDLQPAVRPDDGSYGVYADWLEEHGFAEAAGALRAAFAPEDGSCHDSARGG